MRRQQQTIVKSNGGELPSLPPPTEGITYQRADGAGVAAVRIQKPRDRALALRDAIEEASYLGEQFYYSWPVKNKDGRTQIVEGISIRGAQSLLSTWGNASAYCELHSEDEHAWVIAGVFVDLEKGVGMQRLFRQAKQTIKGRYEPERALDLAFQVGQSKAIRNAILHGLPESFRGQAMESARKKALGTIQSEGVAKARQKCEKAFVGIGVTAEQLEAYLETPCEKWTAEHLERLRSIYRGIQEGEDARDYFGAKEEPEATVDLGLASIIPEEESGSDAKG